MVSSPFKHPQMTQGSQQVLKRNRMFDRLVSKISTLFLSFVCSQNQGRDACIKRGHLETEPPSSQTGALPVWLDKTQHSSLNFLPSSDKTSFLSGRQKQFWSREMRLQWDDISDLIWPNCFTKRADPHWPGFELIWFKDARRKYVLSMSFKSKPSCRRESLDSVLIQKWSIQQGFFFPLIYDK